MKKLILLLLVLTFVSCTKNAENQAKENIEKYIMAKLDDPKSYESVSFGKLEKTKTTVKDDAKYKLLLLELDEIDKKEMRYIIKMGGLLCKNNTNKLKNTTNLEIMYTQIKYVTKTKVDGCVITKNSKTIMC